MADYEEIPQGAIDSLLANPEKAGGFNSVFGTGRAEEVLASRDPQPEPVVEDPEEDRGYLRAIWDNVAEIPGGVVRGIAGGISEIGETMLNSKTVNPKEIERLEAAGMEVPDWYRDMSTQEEFNADTLLRGTIAERETLVGGLTEGISQFAVGLIGAGKFTGLTGLKGAFVNGAIADAFIFDPEDPNLTAALEEWGYDAPVVTDLLATNPDDPEFINRLRNASEGVVMGGMIEAIGWGIKAARATKAGDTKAAAQFKASEAKALRPLDDAIRDERIVATNEARENLITAKEMFGEDLGKTVPVEPDGQLRMDLGDTPTFRPETPTKPMKGRIYLTPEKAERIRMQSQLAKGVGISEKLTGLSWRSPNTMKDWDEVADEVAGISAVLKEEMIKAKGGDVQSLTTVRLKAAAAQRRLVAQARDPEALIKELRTTYAGDPDGMAAEVLAREDFARNIGENIHKMAKALSEGTFHPDVFPGYRNLEEFKLGFNQMLEVYSNVLAGNNANRANIGRAMRAMQIARKSSDGISKILSDPSAFRDIDAVAKALADPKNAGKPITSVADAAFKKINGWMNKVNTFRINALLSGPGTQEVNLISNVINSFVIPAEQFLGGLAKGDRVMMVHATRQLQGYMLGMMDSVKAAGQAGWWNDAVLDPHSLKLEDDALLKSTTAIGKVITLPSRGLMTMDEFFKQSQYRGRVFADAHAEAAAKRLTGGEKEAFIKKYLVESYDEAGGGIREDALLQSRRATFTEPLEPGLASMVQKAAIDHPTVRFFIPFVRTPINILSQTFQHAPILGTASKRFRADIAAGGARAAQARGRQIVGTALVGMAGYMAAQGHVVGAGPSDPRIRAAWLKNNQPYSFRIPQEDGSVQFVSFARLEPLSNIFSIAADAVEIMNDEYNESEQTNVMHAMLLSAMENTVNKTFTQGIYDAMSLFVGRPHEQERAAKNFVASFVPNVLNQTNGDDTLREARTYTDAVMSRTGMYNGVDPKRNVLGEPIIRALPKYDPLGITNKDIRVTDPVLQEITRAAIDNQSVAGAPSKRIPGPNRIDISAIRYEGNPDQTVYDRWLELTGEVKINGKTLREALEHQIGTRDYRVAPEGDINVAGTGTKGSIIRSIISSYREAAKAELPQLRKLIISEKQGTGALLQEQNKRNRDLFPRVTNPKPATGRRTFEDLLK